MRKILVVMAAICASTWGQVWADAGAGTKNTLTIEAGDAGTFGNFTLQDTKIDVDTTYGNPQGLVELQLGSSVLSIGASYAQSENGFTGAWKGDNEDGDGTINAKRSDANAFVRLGSRDSINLRVGYRCFKYKFTDGFITQRENGSVTEIDKNASADGELTKGVDAEFNLVFGDAVQIALGIGGTYFMDADYTWEYDQVQGGSTAHVTGSATLNGYSARVRPEISFKLGDNVRIFANFTLQATTWEGTPDNGKDYPGIDMYSAVAAGVRVML